MLDSLVRVTRRVSEDHFVRAATKREIDVGKATGRLRDPSTGRIFLRALEPASPPTPPTIPVQSRHFTMRGPTHSQKTPGTITPGTEVPSYLSPGFKSAYPNHL